MATKHNPYLDSDEVRRGYYVYIHKAQTTREVFYVGKGHGKRAWDTTRRNATWKEKVAALGAAWDVEIIKENLSEIEAFEHEREIVEQLGGCLSDGGVLTNLIPGGEDPAAVRIECQFGSDGWSEAYFDARVFRPFPRSEKEAIVQHLYEKLQAILDALMLLEDRADEIEDEALFDGVTDLDGIVRSVVEACDNFLRHRISWKEFGLTLEDSVDDVDADDLRDRHRSIRALWRRTAKTIEPVLKRIDSGNRKEAEEGADRFAARKRENSSPEGQLPGYL